MTRLSRRRVLGIAGAGVVAGCLDAPSEISSGSEYDGRADTDTDTGRTDTESGVDYRRPAAGDVDHPPCPRYENADRTVCYDTTEADDEPVVLVPSARTVEHGSSIEFTLRNDGDERFATNFYGWRMDKHVDGEWHRVAPLATPQPLMFVDSGASHFWTVTPDNSGLADGDRIRDESGTESLTLTGVGGGIYAFRARGWVEDARSEEILALAATFELQGEPLELTPTNAIASVEWTEDADGDDVLVVRSDRGEDTEYQRSGAYELEVVDEPDADPRPVIAEQVIRDDQLRDAIALARERDAARVRLEGYDGTTPIFGRGSDGLYEYRGTYYRVRTRELEDG